MGACTFITAASGATADEAFQNAIRAAQDEHGRAGYSGSVAEKTSFTPVACPAGQGAHDLIRALLDGDAGLSPAQQALADQLGDKYGPAGCLQTAPGQYLFFGWASE